MFVRSRVLQIRALGCLPGVRIWLALLLAIFALNALVLVGGRSRIPSAPTLSTGTSAELPPTRSKTTWAARSTRLTITIDTLVVRYDKAAFRYGTPILDSECLTWEMDYRPFSIH